MRAEYRELQAPGLRLFYYAPPHTFISEYTAQCFENSMRFHRRLWNYHPTEPVNLLVDDYQDYSNAGVWGAPRNSMSFHIAPSNYIYETGPSNERVNFTMNHECVHVVALDEAAGSDRLFRTLFHGKVRDVAEQPESMLYSYLTIPRRAAPRWYHEGIAVFLETWMSGGFGRAQGPYDEMVFRAMVRDSTPFWDPLALESEGTKVDFQVGAISYLYGTRFMSYLAWRYGPDSLMHWVARRPGTRKYFANEFHHTFGISLARGWHEWIDWEHGFQRANLDSVRKYPTTPYRDVSHRVLGSVSRAYVDPTTRTLYAGAFYPGAVAHVAALSMINGAERPLVEIKGPALYYVCSLAWDPYRHRLFYSTENTEWRGLCELDTGTGRSTRLIRRGRLGDLAFDRADSSLWAVRHLNGLCTVVRLRAPYTNWTQVYTYPYGTDVYDLDVSPDGQWLVMSMAEINGRQSLHLVKTADLLAQDTTSRTLFDFRHAVPQGFVFSPDGRRLYGSSYYTGVSNIFRYDLERDSMEVLTNGETGFFRPVPLGGDSLVAFRFSGRGFVPTMIADRPIQDVSAITYLGAELADRYPELRAWKLPPPTAVRVDSLHIRDTRYDAFAALRPTTVYPIVQGYKERTATGLRMEFLDPASMNGGDLTVSLTPERRVPDRERLHVMANFQRSSISAGAQINRASFYDLVGRTKVSRKGYGAHVTWTRPIVYDKPRTLDFAVELAGYGGLDRLPDAQNVATTPGFNKLLSTDVRLTYKNLRSSIGAADFEKGWQGELSATEQGVRYERFGRSWWRGFPQFQGSADVGAPFLFRNSSLWLRTAAGGSPGDPSNPFANFYFGGFRNNGLDYHDPKRYREVESFPGRDIDAVGGTTFVRGMLDWNLPALRFGHLGTVALYAPWLRVALFSTGLVTNLDQPADRRRIGNAGAQADLRMQLLTLQPLTLSFGYAGAFERRHRATREWMLSLKVL